MEIKGLYKISKEEESRVIDLFMKAFSEYPKLMNIFPDWEVRKHALEATLQYYIPYDRTYGGLFSLDGEIREAITVIHSDEMGYTEERHQNAGSYSQAYQSAMNHLTPKQQQMRVDLFDELDRLEKEVDIPYPHLYLDFLGVDPAFHGQGRGSRLLEKVSRYAQEQNLPMMLFTNTQEDVVFYTNRGFRVIGCTESEEYGFINTYLVKEV